MTAFRFTRRCRRPALPASLRRAVASAALAGLGLTGLGPAIGCRHVGEPAVTYLGDADLNYYRERATEVAVPTTPMVATDLVASQPPHTVSDRSRDAIRDIGLVETIHLTLANSEVIRERGQFLSPQNSLLTNPEGLNSIYEPGIQESGTGFFNRGVEAALSDFDTQFATRMLWGRDERIQNNLFTVGATPGSTLVSETANFSSSFQKVFATGGQATFSHTWDYDANNATNGRLLPSVYTGSSQAEFRQPLLAGAGVEYNRIAGPRATNSSGTNQVANGVLIARVNSDIQIAELERSVRNIAREAEEAYWNLAFAYRTYDAEVLNRDTVLATWRLVLTRRNQGLQGGGTADEAQARDNYFDARSRVEGALGDLYRREIEIRRLAGLPVSDGSILRPIDEPLTAKFTPDWHTSLAEAVTRRTELRRQRWQIKSLELQLVAAQSLTKPNLDFISRYRVNGFGDNLFGRGEGTGNAQGVNSAYDTLLDGNQTGWDLGFELSLPIGLRAARAQVRNLELRIAKARAGLAAGEHEVSLELAAAFQDLDRFYRVAQSNLNRRVAAEERLRAFETRFQTGAISEGQSADFLDLLLRSQISVAQAEIAYWQAIYNYQQAIADIHLRQGTLLERDGVTFQEGHWDPVAYKQALREAWARSHAVPNPKLHTDPDPFARPGDLLPTAVPGPGPLVPVADPLGGVPLDDLPPLPAKPGDFTPPPTAPPADPAPDRVAPPEFDAPPGFDAPPDLRPVGLPADPMVIDTTFPPGDSPFGSSLLPASYVAPADQTRRVAEWE